LFFSAFALAQGEVTQEKIIEIVVKIQLRVDFAYALNGNKKVYAGTRDVF